MSTKDTCCLFVTGGTNTGKTVAACNVFTHLTLGGGVRTTTSSGREVQFSLVVDPNSDTAGADIGMLTDIYLGMLNGEPFPPANVENHIYELLFLEKGNTICSILYLDYRGGIIKDEKARDNNKEEVDELNYMMEHSTLLIYIIPGDVLNDYISLGGKTNIVAMTREERTKLVRVSEEITQIKTLIERANQQGNEAPLLFYVTKSDLVYNEQEIIPGLERLIRQFSLCRKGRKTLGCHSTLGRNVVIKEVVGEYGISGIRIDTGFEPVGFEVPMMLTVGYHLSAQRKAWASAELQQVDGRNAQKGFSEDILSYLNEHHGNSILYINENGERRPLSEFFQ